MVRTALEQVGLQGQGLPEPRGPQQEKAQEPAQWGSQLQGLLEFQQTLRALVPQEKPQPHQQPRQQQAAQLLG